MFSHILFDVYGTTVDWHTGLTAAFAEVAAERGLSAPGSELALGWHHAYTSGAAEIASGKRSWTDVETILRQSLDPLLETHGLGSLDAADRQRLLNAWHYLPPWQDTVPGLTLMKSAYLIAPLSNGDFASLTVLAKFASLPWDAVISAELFHQYKTHPEVYRGACNLLRRDPYDIVLVACHQPDLDAAKQVGMRTAYVHRPSEFGTVGSNRAPNPTADIVVSDFLELAKRLHL